MSPHEIIGVGCSLKSDVGACGIRCGPAREGAISERTFEGKPISEFRDSDDRIQSFDRELIRLSIGEFDPGSGRTLAACLTHASRTDLGATPG